MRSKEVLLVFYDLPVSTGEERKDSLKFRKKLIRHGYVTLQESVYAKLFHNHETIKTDLQFLRKEAPKKGNICAIPMGLSTFKNMQTIVGKEFNMSLFSDDIVIV